VHTRLEAWQTHADDSSEVGSGLVGFDDEVVKARGGEDESRIWDSNPYGTNKSGKARLASLLHT